MNRQLGCCAVAVVLVTALTNANEVRAALLLNYKLDEIVADPVQTTPDASGNFDSATGTINAVLGHGGTNIPTIVDGPVRNYDAGVQSRNLNKAMSFPGNDAATGIGGNIERVEIADVSSGALDAPFTNFTVSMWLNPSNQIGDRFAIGKMGGSNQRGWQIASPGGSEDLTIDYFLSTANPTVAVPTDRSLKVVGALPLGEWTHVTFVFDGVNGTEAIYLNNLLVPSANVLQLGTLPAVPGILNGANSAAFRVGHRGATGSSVGSWAGGIDDVMIFNESLAFSPTGSATGTGSLLAVAVPEPSTAVIGLMVLCGVVAVAANRQRFATL